MPCSFEHEYALHQQGIICVAGLDEVGRGPLAGPVVACAFVFVEQWVPQGLDDSKKLSPKKRALLYEELAHEPRARWAISIQDAGTIDRINILRASQRAMRDALALLPVPVSHVLVDGLPLPDCSIPQTALVGGDGLSFSIAAASILAKVTRDRMMEEIDLIYPQYGFRNHKGYGTAKHLAALRKHGPCPIHRLSFSPVVQQNSL